MPDLFSGQYIHQHRHPPMRQSYIDANGKRHSADAGFITETAIINPQANSPLFAILITTHNAHSQAVQFILRNRSDTRNPTVKSFLSDIETSASDEMNAWLSQRIKETERKIIPPSHQPAYHTNIIALLAPDIDFKNLEQRCENLEASGLLTTDKHLNKAITDLISEASVNSATPEQMALLDARLAIQSHIKAPQKSWFSR